MKILIIGGTGLISTALTGQLLARGDEVTVYNRGHSPSRLSVQPCTIRGDRTDHAAFEAQMGQVGPYDCVIDMIGYEEADAASVARAFRGRAGHLIFCSTVDVYAKPAPTYPIREDAPRRPITDYARKKTLCEDLLFAAHQRGDLPVSILRATYTYGESARGVDP